MLIRSIESRDRDYFIAACMRFTTRLPSAMTFPRKTRNAPLNC